MIKREVTYPLLYVKTFITVFAQSTRSDDSSAMILYNPCLYFLYDHCPPSFLPFLLITGFNLLKLQTKNSCVFPQVRRILIFVKNNIPLQRSSMHGYPHHQNRLGNMLKPSREEIQKFQRE